MPLLTWGLMKAMNQNVNHVQAEVGQLVGQLRQVVAAKRLRSLDANANYVGDDVSGDDVSGDDVSSDDEEMYGAEIAGLVRQLRCRASQQKRARIH